MRIIDRYLLRQFLQAFVICYLTLTGLYVVFDAFTNLEDFLRSADRAGGLVKLMGTHYGYQSILFFDRTSGLLTLVAAMFTVSWIQRHNEMTALMAAGVSRIRVVRPVIAAAIAITLLAAANRELVIPLFRNELARGPHDLTGDRARTLSPQYDNQSDILICGASTYRNEQRIAEPSFLLPPSLSHYGSQLEAENAYYRLPEGDRPGGYLLEDVRQPNDLDTRSSLHLRGKPVIITPHDAPDWLKSGQCFVVSEVTFEQLTGGQAFRQFASTAQLISALRNQSMDFGAGVRVAIHSRLVNPVLDITLLFLGLPLVISRGSRNVFVAIGMCMGVVSVFLLVVIGFQQLGSSLVLSPALAAWAPLMLFVPPAVGLGESMWH